MIYDGYDFRPLLRVEDIARPFMADISVSSETYGSVEGSVFASSSRGEKVIEVAVRMVRPYAKSMGIDEGFEKARRELAGKLYRTRPCKLVLHDAPDLYDMALMTDASAIEKLVYSRTSVLTFLCPEPSSFGEMRTKTSTGGETACLVDGNDVTEPWVWVEAAGPFTVEFDGVAFEVTGSQTGQVCIDARSRQSEPTGHRVFNADLQTVQYTIFSDFPVWEPGVHKIKCERPYAVSWRERWL